VLIELNVQNFAVIERLRLELAPGFNVLTGETGAGKSILIDAVSGLLGARLGSESIRADIRASTISRSWLSETCRGTWATSWQPSTSQSSRSATDPRHCTGSALADTHEGTPSRTIRGTSSGKARGRCSTSTLRRRTSTVSGQQVIVQSWARVSNCTYAAAGASSAPATRTHRACFDGSPASTASRMSLSR